MKNAKSKLAATVLSLVALTASPALADDPIGNHEVIVLTATYDTSAPRLSADDWVYALNKHVSAYFQSASGYRTGSGAGTPHNQTTWHFSGPMGGAIRLETDYSAPAPLPGLSEWNDPRVFFREMREALAALDEAYPEVLANPANRRVILVLNKNKRGRTQVAMPFRTRRRGIVNIEAIVMSEPFADGQLMDSYQQSGDLIAVDSAGVKRLDLGSISLAAHELGHTLLLPDLYREQSLSPGQEFTGYWCEMGQDNLQALSGFSRQTVGFIDAASGRVELVTPPNPGDDLTVGPLTLFPPGMGRGPSNREVLLLPMPTHDFASVAPNLLGAVRKIGIGPEDVGAGFTGFILEARAKVGLDAKRDSSGISWATGIRGAGFDYVGLPDDYTGGLLVSYAKPWLFGANYPPVNPLEILPRNVPESGTLAEAAYQAGDHVVLDEANHLDVEVLAANADGSLSIRVDWQPPPLPDVAAVDAFLDNPFNGWDIYGSDLLAPGRDPAAAPRGPGDDIQFWHRLEFAGVTPVTRLISVDHRVHVRVKNVGTAPVKQVEATLYVTDPVLFGGFIDWPAVLSNNERFPYSILGSWKIGPALGVPDATTGQEAAGEFHIVRSDGGDGGLVSGATPLEPGAVADAWVRYEPGGPFATWLVVEPSVSDEDRVETAEQLWNNVRPEPFVVFTAVPGSPYTPIDLDLFTQNIDGGPHLMYASLHGVPEPSEDLPEDPNERDPRFWQVDLRGDPAILSEGETTSFSLHLQPPDPAFAAPGESKKWIHPKLTGWMSYGDSFVPIGDLPFEVRLSFATSTSLGLRPKSNVVTGAVEWLEPEHPDGVDPVRHPAPEGLPVVLSITPATEDGIELTPILVTPADPRHTAWTKADGTFEQDVTPFLPEGTFSFAVLAQFPGSDAYAASIAIPLAVVGGLPKDDTGCDLRCAVDGPRRGEGALASLVVTLVFALRRGRRASSASSGRAFIGPGPQGRR